MSIDLSSYKTVADRLVDFFAKHPEGSLRPLNPEQPFEVREIAGKQFVVYVAVAHRSPDDPTPGIGTAWEPFPGGTQFTRDSELMNAETSAWGRAILAIGASDTRHGVASQEEVRNRRAPKRPPREAEKWMRRLKDAHGATEDDLERYVRYVTDNRSDDLLDVQEGDEWNELKGLLRRHDQPDEVDPNAELDAQADDAMARDGELPIGEAS